MNNCTLSGQVKFIKKIEFGSGKTVVNFTLVNRERFNSENKDSAQVSFIDCEAWESMAFAILKNLREGDTVVISGIVKTKTYVGDSGKRKMTTILIQEFFKKEQLVEAIEEKPELYDDSVEDDLPF